MKTLIDGDKNCGFPTNSLNKVLSMLLRSMKNTKNKKKVEQFKNYKAIYISRCYHELKNRKYEMGNFHIFYIYDPKERRIIYQNMYDKLVNHLVSRYILYPAIIPCLIDSNCASRPNKGVKYALDLYKLQKFNISKKYVKQDIKI